MFEKVNPSHPDKLADRIAGALVDIAYSKNSNAKIAVEVLVGHGTCNIIVETSEYFATFEVDNVVHRILGTEDIKINTVFVSQDEHLANNQFSEIKCGDNGIFKCVPVTNEEKELSRLSKKIYDKWHTDGKYILDGSKLIVCQSNANKKELIDFLNKEGYTNVIVNPIGDWTGGINVDSGATNRKLGSDMAESVTGGGLHGKDFSKADVSINIYAWLKAQKTGKTVNLCCAIGDTDVDGKSYSEIVEIAKNFIKEKYNGSFEKFAEWGLI